MMLAVLFSLIMVNAATHQLVRCAVSAMRSDEADA